MKKVLILSTFLLMAGLATAQKFKISFDPVIRNALGEVLKLGLVGGLNQPQFSNMDFNNDGKHDLFIYDRTGDKVIVLISQTDQNGIRYFYDPMYEEYIPKGQEFMRLVDYNDDGKPDLWLYDRARSDSVKLYKNNTTGLPQFDFVKNLQGRDYVNGSQTFPNAKIGQIVGSVPSIVDLDADEDVDFVTFLNPGGSQLILFENRSADSSFSLDSISYIVPDKCYGQVDEANGQLVVGAFCFFQENYKLKKHEATKTIQHFDANNDGDLDLFYGSSEELTNPVYFLINKKSDLNYYKDTFDYIDTAFFLPAIEALIPPAPSFNIVDIDLDGNNDLILAQNETVTGSFPIKQTKNVLYFRNAEGNFDPDWQFVQDDFLVGDMLDLGAYTCPTFADIDDDGDEDLFIATNGDHYISGDSADYIVYLENIGDNQNPDFQIKDMDFAGLKANKYQGIAPQFIDLTNDGVLDLVFGLIDGTMVMIQNLGTTTNPMFDSPLINYLGIDVGTNATPYFYDLDNDADLDLLVGSYDGTIQYYENQSGTFIMVDDTLGGILANALIWQTYLGPNGFVDTLVHQSFGYSSLEIGSLVDGQKAIFLGGYEGKLRVFAIPSDITSSFPEMTNYLEHPISGNAYVKDWGAFTHPAVADLNGDGHSDVIIGNNRGGVHYMEAFDSTVSVKTLRLKPFSLHPNPSLGTVRVEVGNRNKELSYAVKNLMGSTVQAGMGYTSQPIGISEALPNGFYFLEITIDNAQYQPQKFILMR